MSEIGFEEIGEGFEDWQKIRRGAVHRLLKVHDGLVNVSNHKLPIHQWQLGNAMLFSKSLLSGNAMVFSKSRLSAWCRLMDGNAIMAYADDESFF